MNTNTVDAKMLSRMFLSGAKNLEAKKEWINELNVFPVPDGDTGTNMTLTIMSAASEVSALENPTMKTLAKAISSGSLRGARGNSGVILSQLLRGFTKVIEKSETADAVTFAKAFEKGVETAYKAVMKPKEGTILTVAKGAAVKALEIADDAENLESFFADVIAEAEAEARRRVESVQSEIDDKLVEGKKKYLAVQEEMNGIVELINQAQRRFMSSYKEVHQIISSMPTSLNDIEDEMELEIHKLQMPEEPEEEAGEEEELHLGDTQELDILDSLDDIAELEEFDEEDEEDEEDEDSRLALQISRLLSEEDEAMLEDELEEFLKE